MLAMTTRTRSLLVVASFALLACPSKNVPPPPEPNVALPPEPPPAPMSCSIHVVANPPAKILVDGRPGCDLSPCTIDKLPPGAHAVTCVDEVAGNMTLDIELYPGVHMEVSCPPGRPGVK